MIVPQPHSLGACMRRVTVSVTALLDGTPRDVTPRDGESAGRSDRAPRQDGDQVGTVSR